MRRRRVNVEGLHPEWFLYGTHDFTRSYLGNERHFASKEEARAAWPACRRLVWARTHRMRVPTAAEVFDGLTRRGWDMAWSRTCYCAARLPMVDVLDALDEDRDAVAAFRRRDPEGAREIDDFLDLWLADLEAIERWTRTDEYGPGPLSTAARYGAPAPGASAESVA
jgi:hypothetical protein